LSRNLKAGSPLLCRPCPGCVTWGEDYEHALAMAKEAIEGYLEVLAEEGKPIPEEPVTTAVDTLIQVKSPAVA